MKKVSLIAIKSIALLLFICSIKNATAQDDEKFKIEQVKKQCAGLPLEKRLRVSVTKFRVTTGSGNSKPAVVTHNSNSILKKAFLGNVGSSLVSKSTTSTSSRGIPPAIGSNLSTMLTDALQGVNCFRVLESLNDNKELTSEIDEGSSKYSGKQTPKAGKQLGAQVVVVGEVVEYSVQDIEDKNLFRSKSKKFVKIGFNIKLVNPETRDILASNIFRVESKTDRANSWLFASSSEQDPDVAAVMEDGIVQAVEFIAKTNDSLHLSVDGSTDGLNTTEVILKNATYGSFSSLASILSSYAGYKSMEKSFSDGVGDYTISHTGKSDDLLEELNKKLDSSKFEVIGFDTGKIEIKAK